MSGPRPGHPPLVTLGLARLAAQRAAAEAWRHRTGGYPEGLETVSP